MEPEEINGLLWETLVREGQAMTCEQLARETGIGLHRVQVGLTRLREANLVQPDGSPRPAYAVLLALDALRWAQAVGLGVSLHSLEKHAHLSSAGRAEALRLATDGSVEQVETRMREEKRASRETAIRGRAASKAAASDLAQILKDTELAMRGATQGRSNRDTAVAFLLRQANEETQKALNGLVRTLQGK